MSLIYNTEGVSFKNLYVVGKSLYQPKYQELGLVMKSIPEIGFFVIPDLSTVPCPDEILPFSIIIFDDVATENDRNQHLRAYFSMGRHKHVDSFFLCQTYSSIPKQLVRDNANVSITHTHRNVKKKQHHVFSFVFLFSRIQVLVLFRQDQQNLKHVYNDHVNPDVPFSKFCDMCALAWNSNQFGCLVINRECDINNGRYRIGFDQFIDPS